MKLCSHVMMYEELHMKIYILRGLQVLLYGLRATGRLWSKTTEGTFLFLQKGVKVPAHKIPLSDVIWLMRAFRLSIGHEPRCEKTGLRGFRPGPTQTRLYSYRRWLEA